MPAGSVEVRWSAGWMRDGYGWSWEVAWCDGPTVARMRHVAVHEVSGGPGIDALVHGGRVRYARALSLTAVAVQLVTHVRAGGSPPDLDDVWQAGAWLDALEQTDFPECAPSMEEQVLARLLVARGLADYQRALAVWARARAEGRRAVAPLPQALLCRAVAAFGGWTAWRRWRRPRRWWRSPPAAWATAVGWTWGSRRLGWHRWARADALAGSSWLVPPDRHLP